MNKVETNNNPSLRKDPLQMGPTHSCDNLTVLEKRLKDKSTTQVQILKGKNQKTKINMKSIDIS